MRFFYLISAAAVAGAVCFTAARAQQEAPAAPLSGQPVPTKELTLFKGAQSAALQPLGTPAQKAFYTTIVSSTPANASMSCGFLKMEKGEPIKEKYTFVEVKLIVDGSINVTDGKKKFTATKGDVVIIPIGTEASFSTDDHGTAFVCVQS